MNWNSKEYNEIALNKIWSEHVEKEAEQIAKAVKTTYTVNQTKKDPFDSVTDKVGYRVGLDPVTLPDDKDVKEVVAGLLAGDKIPQEKYEAPMTSAQEVGWFYEPLVKPNPKFQHNLVLGDATTFAENYTKKMAGAHLFHGASGKYLKF